MSAASVVRKAHVPNATLSVREVCAALVRPADLGAVERWLERELAVEHAVAFASARAALAASIAILAPGRSVALPGYTCVAVANALSSAGATPCYVDVDGRGLVPSARWPKSAAAVLVQDTYGFVSELPAHCVVIRDAAHRIDLVARPGATVSVTSFEHSKSLSAGQGGLAVTADAELAVRLRELRDRGGPSVPALRHGIVTLLSLGMGRAQFAGRNRAAGRISRIVRRLEPNRLVGQSDDEKRGAGVDSRLLGPPNRVVLALMRSQLKGADGARDHRARIVGIYDDVAGIDRTPDPLLRYPMQVADPASFEDRLRHAGWDLAGRWFVAPLHPVASDEPILGYEPGTAPTGERLAATVVNLPTHPLVRPRLAHDLMCAALDAGAQPVR